MNVSQLIEEFKEKYPAKKVVVNDNLVTSEMLCEVDPTSDHPDYSKAIAVINKSVPHIHVKSQEKYKVIKGTLDLYLGSNHITLQQGDVQIIEPNTPHWAEGKEVWVECTSNPGWSFLDHILVGQKGFRYPHGTHPPKTWVSNKVIVRSSEVEGKGMFVLSPIKAGEAVVMWGGEYTNAEGADKAKQNGKLVMQWDDDLYSVEDRGDDDSYFINHSCDPNLWMVDAFTLVARKDLPIGTELTADYALWEGDDSYVSKWECKCGSSLCRKSITGKDWQTPDIQIRYKDHFSPLINKKIENMTHQKASQ